jgi:hypothetical protein
LYNREKFLGAVCMHDNGIYTSTTNILSVSDSKKITKTMSNQNQDIEDKNAVVLDQGSDEGSPYQRNVDELESGDAPLGPVTGMNIFSEDVIN